MPDDNSRGDSRPVTREDVAGSIDVVKQVFAAFGRRDRKAAAALFDREGRFYAVTSDLTRGGHPYEGPAGIEEYFDDVGRIWQELEPRPLQFEAVVDAVVVIGEVRARGPGGELCEPTIWSWKLRDGLVLEGRVHSDLESARRVLGRAPGASRPVRIAG